MANSKIRDNKSVKSRRRKESKKKRRKENGEKRKSFLVDEDKETFIRTLPMLYPKMFTSKVLRNENALTYQKAILSNLGKERMIEEYTKINERLTTHPAHSPVHKEDLNQHLNPELYWRFTMDRPISEIEVVIIGQDPGDPEFSCGLAFSYPHPFEKLPEYSANCWIIQELEDTVPGFKKPPTGDLSPWSRRGVLLMNSDLTIHYHHYLKPHRHLWFVITTAISIHIARHNPGTVFMLWGNGARMKSSYIESETNAHPKPLILESYHPCAKEGKVAELEFNGSGHFAKARKYQEETKGYSTEWRLPLMSFLPEKIEKNAKKQKKVR